MRGKSLLVFISNVNCNMHFFLAENAFGGVHNCYWLISNQLEHNSFCACHMCREEFLLSGTSVFTLQHYHSSSVSVSLSLELKTKTDVDASHKKKHFRAFLPPSWLLLCVFKSGRLFKSTYIRKTQL